MQLGKGRGYSQRRKSGENDAQVLSQLEPPGTYIPTPFNLLTLPDYTNEQLAGYDDEIDKDQIWGFKFPNSSMDPQSEQNNIFVNNPSPLVPSASAAASSSTLSYLHLSASTHPASLSTSTSDYYHLPTLAEPACLSTSMSGYYHLPTLAHPESLSISTSGYHFPTSAHPASSSTFTLGYHHLLTSSHLTTSSFSVNSNLSPSDQLQDDQMVPFIGSH